MAALALPCAASAQMAEGPSATTEDEATGKARALFNDATSIARHGDWPQALLAFERSAALRPHAVTTYNIGFCERALGRTTRARKMFGKALAENTAHGGAELPDRLAAAARAYLAELEGRVAHAVVTIAPEGSSILVDGRPLERAVTGVPRPVLWAGTRDLGPGEPVGAGTFELQIDPGPHFIVVSKGGYAEEVMTRDFKPGAEVDLIVNLSPAPTAGPAPARPAADKQPGRTPGSRAPLYVALGVGGAGLMTGAIAGGIALAQRANVVRNCSASFACSGAGATYLARTDTAADVSTAGFVVGGLGAVTAAFIWWLAPARSGSSSKPSAARVTPWIAPGVGGVAGTF